ncbi:hypothetical protein HPB47_010495 [Ixodes persulcatus]|uniref:Uncharacterized protein n=1 Tax=Ixodes persulcatus TaxID=34615 RepID=A0AC60NYY2_IXOPE|nr:hypothetical protein HPB47_010495 [Ixodes persulcatus]
MISPGGPVNLGASTSGTSKKGPRVHWSEAETWSLIRLWEDNIGELRRQTRNAGVYETIRLGLERLSIERTWRQTQRSSRANSGKHGELSVTFRTLCTSLLWISVR